MLEYAHTLSPSAAMPAIVLSFWQICMPQWDMKAVGRPVLAKLTHSISGAGFQCYVGCVGEVLSTVGIAL